MLSYPTVDDAIWTTDTSHTRHVNRECSHFGSSSHPREATEKEMRDKPKCKDCA